MLARVLHIILSLLVFVSSSGFIINSHYCQNELKSQALFVQPITCHEAAKMPTHCPKHQKWVSCKKKHKKGEQEDKNCCKTNAEYFHLEQDQQVQVIEFQEFNNFVLIATVFTFLHIDLPVVDTTTPQYLNYKPPLIVCNFQTALQTFLL